MSTLTLRNTKGTPLTNSEVDANFSALNDDKMEKSANLGDVASASTARDNLDVYSTTEVDAAVGAKLSKASNLSDVTNAATARDNLDVYSTTEVDTAVAAKLTKASNLSDVTNAGTARTNLDVPSVAEMQSYAVAMAIALG